MKWHFVNFNPRTREGCDLEGLDKQLAHMQISIHAPARGATDGAAVYIPSKTRFQSTHPRGVRLYISSLIKG